MHTGIGAFYIFRKVILIGEINIMKILFISFNDITDEKYGRGQCSRRNLISGK